MTDKLSLAGQAAIVTGGGGGIGRAIAIEFARAGADIVIADIIAERAVETASRVREFGRQAVALTVDVMQTDQVRQMVQAADAAFGRIDILDRKSVV